MSPVGKQLVGDETTGDLSYNVTPEEGAMDQSHCLWVPVKLSFLERKKITEAHLKCTHLPSNCIHLVYSKLYIGASQIQFLKEFIKRVCLELILANPPTLLFKLGLTFLLKMTHIM